MKHYLAVLGMSALVGCVLGVFTLILIFAMKESMLAGAQMPDDDSRLAPMFLMTLAPALVGWLAIKMRERFTGIAGGGHTLLQALAASAGMAALSLGPAAIALDPFPTDATFGVAAGAVVLTVVALISDWAAD